MIFRVLCLMFLLFTHVSAASFMSGWYNSKGVKAYQAQDYTEAVSYFSDALTQGEEQELIESNIGRVYADQSLYDEALQAYTSALKHAKGVQYDTIASDIGKLLISKQDYAQAATVLKDALRKNVHNSRAKKYLEFAIQQMEEDSQQPEDQDDDPELPQDEENEDESEEKQDDNQDEDQSSEGSQNQPSSQEAPNQQQIEALLDSLSQHEKEAREKFLKQPVQEETIENDW